MKFIVIAIVLSAGAMSMFPIFKKKASDTKLDTISSHLAKEGTEKEWSKIAWKEKDKTYWKKVLDPVVYHITRQHGTERPFTGKYVDWKKEGTFICSNCGQKLFSSNTKFKSGTGWPSFWDVIDQSKIIQTKDHSFGTIRTEISCSRCSAHLGHVFNDGPKPTGLRYCINSVALNFIK